MGERSHQTINNVLENYLNRNSFSPSTYFTEEIESLRKIWDKFHHNINYVERIKNSDRLIKQSTMFGFESGKNSITIGQQEKARIAFLEQQLEEKIKIISKLR